MFSAVCEARSLVQIKVSFVLILFDRFPMFLLRPGLGLKKHDGLSLFERELLQRNTLIKMKIPTMTLFWRFKACVMCEIFSESLYIFKVSQGRK